VYISEAVASGRNGQPEALVTIQTFGALCAIITNVHFGHRASDDDAQNATFPHLVCTQGSAAKMAMKSYDPSHRHDATSVRTATCGIVGYGFMNVEQGQVN